MQQLAEPGDGDPAIGQGARAGKHEVSGVGPKAGVRHKFTGIETGGWYLVRYCKESGRQCATSDLALAVWLLFGTKLLPNPNTKSGHNHGTPKAYSASLPPSP